MQNCLTTNLDLIEIKWENEPGGFIQKSNLLNWELAYWAKELRQNKSIKIICSMSEANDLYNGLQIFYNQSNLSRSVTKKNHTEVMMEVMM